MWWLWWWSFWFCTGSVSCSVRLHILFFMFREKVFLPKRASRRATPFLRSGLLSLPSSCGILCINIKVSPQTATCVLNASQQWRFPTCITVVLRLVSSLWVLLACSGDCGGECEETQREPWPQPSSPGALSRPTGAAPSLPPLPGQSNPQTRT